jgi:hypothetical protein
MEEESCRCQGRVRAHGLCRASSTSGSCRSGSAHGGRCGSPRLFRWRQGFSPEASILPSRAEGFGVRGFRPAPESDFVAHLGGMPSVKRTPTTPDQDPDSHDFLVLSFRKRATKGSTRSCERGVARAGTLFIARSQRGRAIQPAWGNAGIRRSCR